MYSPMSRGMAEGRMMSTVPVEKWGSGSTFVCRLALASSDMCGARHDRGIALGEVVGVNECRKNTTFAGIPSARSKP